MKLTLRDLYRRMSAHQLRDLRNAFRLDRAARPFDRRLQAFAAYRMRLIGQVLREKT